MPSNKTPTCSRTHLVHKIDPSIPGYVRTTKKERKHKNGWRRDRTEQHGNMKKGGRSEKRHRAREMGEEGI
jgi:hypothetical protein